MNVVLSDEQMAVVAALDSGKDVIVDATYGSGKTSTIAEVCNKAHSMGRNVLYLTYSKLLKLDAQRRVTGAKVQNYHGIVYPYLMRLGIRCGISESIAMFNRNFNKISPIFTRYDLLVVDEYQDINEEYAILLDNIKSTNPLMQIIMVGDMSQKVRDDTTFDVQSFVRGFCTDPLLLPFTQSFRSGQELADLLSQAWNKPIKGVNLNQKITVMDRDKAFEKIRDMENLGDLLCLGTRNGTMAKALNSLEANHKDRFNKKTVYASIKDSDQQVSYGDDVAVFTTFDGSKGMERKVCIVFDYDEQMWQFRVSQPNVNPEILRNIFLVAASRGKDEIIFVSSKAYPDEVFYRGRYVKSDVHIGGIEVDTFIDLPKVQKAQYKESIPVTSVFEFKYVENIEACYNLLDLKRVDDGDSFVIDVDRADDLIDLSPAVGHYQEYLAFDRYEPKREFVGNPKEGSVAERLWYSFGKGAWPDALVMAAISTEQMRYATQVTKKINQDAESLLRQRIHEHLPPGTDIQRALTMHGGAAHSRQMVTPITFTGVVDAIKDDVVWELKYVSELTHPMFLQVAMYLVMSGCEVGVLWNTRNNERWEVRVPDRNRFMDAVILCTTKQDYKAFFPLGGIAR